jgi:hypothetical protein
MARSYQSYKASKEEQFIVLNQNGQVFAGLKEGYPNYSDDWSEAKPLSINNTSILLREKGTELINTKEL